MKVNNKPVKKPARKIHLTINLSESEIEMVKKIAKMDGCSFHDVLYNHFFNTIGDLKERVEEE